MHSSMGVTSTWGSTLNVLNIQYEQRIILYIHKKTFIQEKYTQRHEGETPYSEHDLSTRETLICGV